ncbi:pyruvate carboxylase [Nitrobacteraceae bacterium AZCC 2161]
MRSEIAIRILRAANELEIPTVSVWSEEDRQALRRFKADEAFQIGRGPHLQRPLGPIESYLSIDELIRVARRSGADAVHPGYGLLSESPEFAEACADEGLLFIGPRPATMKALGNMVAARELAGKLGVPTVPATPPLPNEAAQILRSACPVHGSPRPQGI